MKKTLIILSIAFVSVGIFYFLKNQNRHGQLPVITDATNGIPPEILTNQEISKNTKQTSSEPPVIKFENISDLKQIRTLKLLQSYPGTQSWLSYHKLVPFQLNGQNGKTITFEADVVDAEIITTNGRVQSLELQAPYMNIDETRAFGLQLCALLDIDPKAFSAWCDKVGNRWVDQPVFYSGAGTPFSPNKIVAYNVRHTFNNEKPWYIDFVFSDK